MNAVQLEQIKTYAGRRKLCYDELVFEQEIEQCKQERAKKNGNGEPERVICWCDEGVINGKRVPVHRPEDCAYVARRSALVPEAARIATAKIGDPKGATKLGYAWTRQFDAEITRLAAPLLRQ